MKKCNDIEDQILEKTKVALLYNQQKKALEVSLEYLEQELKSNIDDAYFALQMKQVSKREHDKITERIKALKVTLESLYSDVFKDDLVLDNIINEEDRENHNATKPEEEEEKTVSQSVDPLLESKKQLCEMFHELKISGKTQSSDGELAVVRLRFLLQQIALIYEKITKEYNLLVSKCHQIHQAESCLDNLRVDVLAHELAINQFLQIKVASKSKSEAKVLKVSRLCYVINYMSLMG